MPFDVTLTWTDEAAAVNASPAIVNSLRLEVVTPDGDVWTQKLPPSFSTANANPLSDTTTANYDNRNTVQRVRFTAPADGTYQIRVRGISVPLGPQKYALAATGSFRTGDTSADFTLRSSPASRGVCTGQAADFAIGVQRIAGFNSPVTLSVLGLPGSSSGSFTPAVVVPADPAASSTLTVSNTNGVASGSYNLVIRGATTTPALQRNVSATLNVATAVPASTSLTRPADNSSNNRSCRRSDGLRSPPRPATASSYPPRRRLRACSKTRP